jgi:hypothetical protein
MASMLLDYLVTDVFVRSKAQINFPAEFIEGYAYLQSNMYGTKKGNFFDENAIQLWMPKGLLSTSNVELNYISGRKNNSIFLAFTNQANQVSKAKIRLSLALLKINEMNASYSIYQSGKWVKQNNFKNGEFEITLPANGLLAVKIDQVEPIVSFQQQIQTELPFVKNDAVTINLGDAHAYSFRMGKISKAYVFLKADDNQFRKVSLSYSLKNGTETTLVDNNYPFEFTIDLPTGENALNLQLEAVRKDGTIQQSKPVKLGM